jgi:hypothetical protein
MALIKTKQERRKEMSWTLEKWLLSLPEDWEVDTGEGNYSPDGLRQTILDMGDIDVLKLEGYVYSPKDGVELFCDIEDDGSMGDPIYIARAPSKKA